MSNEFDDLPSGGGEAPTKDQVLAVYNHMRARNGGKDPGTKAVTDEVIACGFTTSRASVGRALKGAEGRAAPPAAPNDADRRAQRRRQNNRDLHKDRDRGGPPPKPPSPEKKAEQIKSIGDAAERIVQGLDDKLIGEVMGLLEKKDGVPLHSTAELAIEENRVRMALNIMLGRRMMEKSEFLLLDMRGTAALVDALTVASKLSGGSAIDVKPAGMASGQVDAPLNGFSPNGHPMKELNPPVAGLAADLAKFRRERAAERAQRT